MPARVTEATVDEEELHAILRPRRALVVERQAADGEFVAERGPVASYRRKVTWRNDGPARLRVRQELDFRLAIPFWGFLFTPLYARALARLTERRERTPWWAPPDALDARAATMLASLAALSTVAVYPSFLLTQTLTFAAREFDASRGAQGLALSAVRTDVLIALSIVALADRRGRRRIALVSVAVACVVTATGALSPNLAALAASQVVARGLLAAAGILIAIMAAEEMPAGSRAYAVSLLSIAAAPGAAVALFLLPLADLHLRAWRLLFVVALLWLPALAFVARRLPESRRFAAPHPSARLAGHGRRFWLLAVSAFLFALFFAPAAQFQNEYLRAERGFSAARITLFIVATNVWGGIGVFAGGHLADVRGRRIVGAIGVGGGVAATVLMFLSHGWPLWAWSVVGAIVGAVTVPALGVYGPELFPTSMRGRANGVISGLGRVGSVVGLLIAGVLADQLGSLGPALALLALGPLLVVVLIVVAYPETAHMELEELNPEDRQAASGSNAVDDDPEEHGIRLP